MFKKDDNFSYKVDEDFDFVVDEKQGGNSFLALRKVSWGEDKPFKLDLRKWFTGSDGKEVPGKGVTFLDEEKGPNELIKVFLTNGYGNTRDVLNSIKDRDDFQHQVDIVTGKIKDDSPEANAVYYDPKEALLD